MRTTLILLALVLHAGTARADAWRVPPAGYAHAPIARCADPVSARLKPNEARYDICADQMALFNAALDKARASGRLLIVDFGATWCPSCRSLEAQWPTAELLGHKSPWLEFSAAFELAKIGVSTIDAGRRIDVPDGHAVLREVLAATDGVKLRAVPFLAVIDPAARQTTVARNLDDFEVPGTGRHDPKLIRAFLAAAHAHMRNGAAPPAEPGWLKAKFNRAWMRLFGS